MSSILLNPIMRWPAQSIDEKRGETFATGAPIVFHTAPPQPASKARMICSPQLVGGAEASQKGLIHWMPAKVLAKVGLGMGWVLWVLWSRSKDKRRSRFPSGMTNQRNRQRQRQKQI